MSWVVDFGKLKKSNLKLSLLYKYMENNLFLMTLNYFSPIENKVVLNFHFHKIFKPISRPCCKVSNSKLNFLVISQKSH